VHEAVRSVVGQRFAGRLEVLVVFDASEPHPIEVELPAGRTLRTLVNDARTPGLAGARNTGILAADGDLVAFLDDDDSWVQGKLEAQLAAMRRHDVDVFCGTGSVIVGDDGERPRPGPSGTVSHDDLLRDRIMEISSGSFLVDRRRLVDDIGLVDERLPGAYGEDYDLLLRAARVMPVINVAEPLVRVTFHGGSFYASRWRVIIDALTYLLDKHPEFRGSPPGRARIHGQLAFAHAALGERGHALRYARSALRGNPVEKRAYVAALVAMGLPASTVASMARRRGRGV
jgi:glycosyltransferase involved in cell wall biosynthesis